MKLSFLKKAKKNEIMVFAAAVCVVITIGYYFLFLGPVMSRLAFLFKECSGLQSKLSMAELSINRAPKIKGEIEEIKSKVTFYSEKLPREEEFPSVLERMSDIAQDALVKITKILPVKDSQLSSDENRHPNIYQQKEILINAQCGYHQLGAFIAALENAERFMEISDIMIESRGISPKRHNVQLEVKTFILKGEDE